MLPSDLRLRINLKVPKNHCFTLVSKKVHSGVIILAGNLQLEKYDSPQVVSKIAKVEALNDALDFVEDTRSGLVEW